MLKCVLFDVDGTILDTISDITTACNYALNYYGYKKRSIEDIKSFVGNGLGKTIELAIPNGINNPDYEKVLMKAKEYYAQNPINEAKPYPYMQELIKELKDLNIKVGIVSNKPHFVIGELIDIFFKDNIDFYLGDKEGIKRKPDPEAIIIALNELKVTFDQAVYVGDSEVDVKTGKNAKMDVLACSYGFRSKADLISAGAKYIFDDVLSLRDEIIRRIYE